MELESLEIKIQAQAQQASGQIDALVTRLGRLSSALSGLNTGNLNSLSTGVNRLAGAMTAMRGIDTRTFSAVARNVSKLGSINSKQINAAAGSMRQISNALKGISGMSASVKGLTELASAIKQLGYQSSTKAIENIPKLAIAMRQLMSELSKAPSVSRNIIDMTNALAKLSRTGGAAGTAAKSITSSFSGFSSGASAVTKKSFSLASAIGKVYATYWALFRGFRLLGDAIDISSSLTEVENVVRQTFGQYESLINNFAKTSIEKFGMSELSAKQFASRFQAMGTALDIPQGQMAKMSIRLTELAGDMASFYDVSQEDIAKSLQSVFSGTTAPMRRYGIDLTQATLKEWALKQGLDANISSMTQAEKAMLRYQYVLAHTTNITGDFARTADTWHNQITMLKENFKALGAVVGGGLINAFKPFIKVLNSVLQKVISFAEMVTNALGSIFGWKYEASKGAGISGLADDIGSASDGMDDLSNAAGNAGKNTGGIAKNAKKAKKEIQQATRAFDELKVISKQSKDNTSGSGSGGSGGSGGGSGGGDTGKLVQTDTIFKKFKSDIKDLEGLGKAISGALINAMRGIEWDEVYAKASGFGSGLAKFLNGLFEGQKGTTLFGETGKLIANSLNTVLHGLDSFGTTFNWKQFGNSIADGINKFFQNFDFALLAQTLNSWAQGAFDAVTTALSKISWKDVWNGAKEFLSNLDVKTVAIIVGALTIKKILGLHLAKTALGIIGTSISKAIAGSIAAKLGVEIGANATIGEVLSTGLSKKISGLGTIAGKIGKLALTVGAIVIAAEAGLSLGKAIGNKIADATQPEEMKKYRVDFKFSDLFTYSLDDWKQGFSDWWNDTWGPGLAAWWEDRKAGNTKLKIPFTDFELPSDNEVKKAVSDWWDKQKKKIEKRTENVIKFTADVKDTSSKWWSNVKKWWGEKVGKVKEFTTDVKDSAKEWWSNTKKYWGQKVGQVKKFTTAVQNDASKWWNNTKKYWAEKVGKVKEFTTGVKNKAGEWWSNVKKWWESTTVGKEVKRFTVNVKKAGGTWWKDVSNEWKEKVVNAGRTLKIGISFATNALKNLWSSVSTFFSGKTVNVKTKGSTTKKADGGVFSGGSWKPIKKYAVGGLPNMGQMFVAREAGPELVGTLGGHTAVMNNDQIVQSVSDGVYRAVLAAMRGQKTSSGSQPVQIVLDGKVIFDSTRQSAQEYFNRTGMSPFPV